MTYTPQEQRVHREALCAALRSGEYEQARGRLRRVDTFCCLGVGCEISALGKWTVSDGAWYYVVLNGDTASHVLPQDVQDYYGLRQADGAFGNQSLYKLNDNYHQTFREIADIIESEPEGLLTPEAAAWRLAP